MLTIRGLASRSFVYYFRSSAAAIAGAAIATAVITGALLVGTSVRASLHDLADSKLGKTGKVVVSATFFRDGLASEMAGGAAPLIALEGVLTHDNRRVSGVQIYGIDSRFWAFHGVPDSTPATREIAISAAVASELDAKPGDALLIRLEQPSAIPRESLHGRKEDAGKTIRVEAAAILDRSHMGEFSLRPQQGPTRAVFVRLENLQRDVDRTGRVNTILFPPASQPDLNKMKLEDFGVKLNDSGGSFTSVETDSAVIQPSLEDAIRKVAPEGAPFLTYLVNRITVSGTGKSIPYSLITAVAEPFLKVPSGKIVLNDWAARDLGVSPGAAVESEYYVWDPQGSLLTKTARFEVDHIVPTVDDRSMAPEYPGITNSESLQGWDPPFPMNLKLVRPTDEDYWKRFRTTPKGFISIEDGRRIWSSRFGQSTMIRVYGVSSAQLGPKLRAVIDPAKLGVTMVDVRSNAAAGAQGSVDFGEYFLYFSFFLMVSALLLLVLFFQFAVEQRMNEIGMLRAVGWDGSQVRRLFLIEGGLVAMAGSLLGAPLAIAYSALVLLGLRTIWKSAVGTTDLTLHLDTPSLLIGWATGLVVAALTILVTIGRLRKSSPRELLAGLRPAGFNEKRSPIRLWIAAITGVGAISLAIAGWAGIIPATGAFFGAGSLLLMAALMGVRTYLGTAQAGLESVATLGFRNASWRPLRSTLSIGLVASASFLLLALESFRQQDPEKGAGGYTMLGESQIPIVYDLNSEQGRESTGIANRRELQAVRFTPFRLKAGEDASCLNLYEPRNPRVLGASAAFLGSKRFEGEWKLLTEVESDGTIPAIGDANSLQYVLHKNVGDIFELPGGVRLKIVGALENSVLQSELVISEANFIRAFPDEQGFRFFLIDGPLQSLGALEEALSDFGFDATSAAGRLAAYHQVENTYLSTFQVLGALGLLLGTAGLAAVLMRNIVERRRELALLLAVGYRPANLRVMVIAENALLACTGLAIGLGAALVAILPQLARHGWTVPGVSLLGLIILVPLVAISASFAAVRLMRTLPLLESLRSGTG